MWPALMSLAAGEVKTEAQGFLRRAVAALVLGLVAGVMLLFALGALLVAIYSALAPEHGPVVAALLVAAMAFVLAVAALVAMKLWGSKPAVRRSASVGMPAVSLTDMAQGTGPVGIVLGALILGLIVGRKL